MLTMHAVLSPRGPLLDRLPHMLTMYQVLGKLPIVRMCYCGCYTPVKSQLLDVSVSHGCVWYRFASPRTSAPYSCAAVCLSA